MGSGSGGGQATTKNGQERRLDRSVKHGEPGGLSGDGRDDGAHGANNAVLPLIL